MKFLKAILVMNIFCGFVFSGCGGSSGKGKQPDPTEVPVNPIDPGPPIGGTLIQYEVCQNLERNGIIKTTPSNSGDRSITKISISNADGQSTTYECPGTLTVE
ncbi:MAG: hypothetical protein EOP07_20450 [Proteobacteria bacterium]|nr:MAG: hypothetical protein EOP07_20450 [Pseudomonadota bacterium]